MKRYILTLVFLVTAFAPSVSAAEAQPPLTAGWNFRAGSDEYVESFVEDNECVTAIWQFSNVNGWVFWRAWFRDEASADFFPVQYLFEDESYWIWCADGE